MTILVVVDNPKNWPLSLLGVELVSSKAYLTDASFSKLRSARVFNLCRSYRYQSLGYYVSLLAEARGHRPVPNIATIRDMKTPYLARAFSDDMEELIQECLTPIKSESFTLSIYFGRNMAKRYERLARQLFNLYPAPLLRAEFGYDTKWKLRQIEPIPASEIPDSHKPFVIEAAQSYFANRSAPKRKAAPRYALGILYDATLREKPSNDKAIEKFEEAAEELGIATEILSKEDFGRLAEFDALFIRETTAVNHHTFRFARRAAAEGLVVIDDPDSILRCTNKVFLAEALERHKIAAPKTMIIHRDNVDQVVGTLGLPCVLKEPDGAFSLGVKKASTEEELRAEIERLLEDSDLIIGQGFLPTDFDWRVGVLDGQPLWVCKYHMAKKHWQIVKRDETGDRDFGKVETLPVEQAPRHVIATAVKACEIMGDGLYGVDLKQVGRKCYVIEVNDNPNIDAGYEDAVLKDELYDRIMGVFLSRIERSKRAR